MLHIDYRDSKPLYEQIADNFEHMAVCGALVEDEQLPSVRQLAMELSMNPNTIQRAYSELERRGVAYSVKGRGNFISPDCKQLRRRKIAQLQEEITSRVCEARKLGAEKQEIISWIQDGIIQGEGTK